MTERQSDKDEGAAMRLSTLAYDIQKLLRHHLIREGKGVEESRRMAQQLVTTMLTGTTVPELQALSGETPRTDARITGHEGTASLGELAGYYNALLDHARQLERELAEQTNEAKRWRQACQDSDEAHASSTLAQLPCEAEIVHKLRRGCVSLNMGEIDAVMKEAADYITARSAIKSPQFREYGTLHRPRTGDVYFIQKEEREDFPIHTSKTVYVLAVEPERKSP